MSDPSPTPEPNATAGASSYDLLVGRLRETGAALRAEASALNDERAEVFAARPMTLAEAERFRTETPSIPADLVVAGGRVLLAHDPVVTGPRTVTDLFSVFRLAPVAANDWDVLPVPQGDDGWFLDDPSFTRDLSELLIYYADSRVAALQVVEDILLMVFAIGEQVTDTRVLRWRIAGDELQYLDAYGEVPADQSDDVEWQAVARDAITSGRDPVLDLQGLVQLALVDGHLVARVPDPVTGPRQVLRESVLEPGQDLAELKVRVARVGEQLAIRLTPYRETTERLYVFNRVTGTLTRDDGLAGGIRTLPGAQGIVFPGGYHLANGEAHTFADAAVGTWTFHHRLVAPNGEDVLFAYHDRGTGRYLLCGYNQVTKTMANPVPCDGYGRYADGTMLVLREADEGSRVHAVGIYTSPFCDPDVYEPPVASGSFFGRIGNPELVAVLGECFALARDVERSGFNEAGYEAITVRTRSLLDTYAWFADPEATAIAEQLRRLGKTAGQIIDEFAAVTAARKTAHDSVQAAASDVTEFRADATIDLGDTVAFIERLTQGRVLLGRLGALAEVPYVDAEAVAALTAEATEVHEQLAVRTLEFLHGPEALRPLADEIAAAEADGTRAGTTDLARQAGERITAAGDRVVVLTEVVGDLEGADAPTKTTVLAALADLLARRNAAGAAVAGRVESLRTAEAGAEFTAAMAVLTQRAATATASAADPAAVDASLAALESECESLDARFGDVAEFATALADKRDEIYSALTTRRETLAAERASRVDRIVVTARRALAAVADRAAKAADLDAFETFFATDSLVAKVTRAAKDLRDLGEAGRADELVVALADARATSRRVVVDRADLFGDDGSVRIGGHRFGVNTTPFDLHLAVEADGDGLELRLTGTDLVDPVPDELVAAIGPAASQVFPSETPTLPRAVFLAFELQAAGKAPADARAEAQGRLEDGFELGIHDADAARLLEATAAVWRSPGLWIDGGTRAVAAGWLLGHGGAERRDLDRRLQAVRNLGRGRARRRLLDELAPAVVEWGAAQGVDGIDGAEAVGYLVDFGDRLAVCAAADALASTVREWAGGAGIDLEHATLADVAAYVADTVASADGGVAVADARLLEAALAVRHRTELGAPVAADLRVRIDGLLSTHPLITAGTIEGDVDVAHTVYRRYQAEGLPRFRAAADARRQLLKQRRGDLGVAGLKASPIGSFVRNALIDDVYLPLIGANLAKQLGREGAAQGALLLISPPGYGKTTLVEYVAGLLGFALVKINGPALGPSVTSLDPAAAPDAASAAELVRLNQAFAMGNNVICYLDDVQHTSQELLSRFIPLCDATRRIEGVWHGAPRTYELSGRRFAMVLAGNPYTGSGERFELPDMLVNRSDVHNLGDVVAGRADLFARSYLEVAAGSNPTLAPVVLGDRADLDVFLRAVGGEPVESKALSRPYPAADVRAITAVLGHLVRVRDRLLVVNDAYIRSATLDDGLRGEPPFLLQGSYRNMAKVASRIVPVMTAEEVEAVLDDHYRTEAQTLATDAAWNLARLAELVAPESPAAAEAATLRARWAEERAAANPALAVTRALGGIEDALRDEALALVGPAPAKAGPTAPPTPPKPAPKPRKKPATE